MAKITFEKAEIQRVEWVKNTGAGNPQYRITFNTYSGHRDDLIRSSWSMLTEANAGWAWGIDAMRYNRGEPKMATIKASRTETRERITDLEEE